MLEATADVDETVAYLATVRPFAGGGLRAALRGTDVVLVEPYLAGTSAGEVVGGAQRPPAPAARARRRRLAEFRHYGEAAEHRAAHGLDARGIRAALAAFGSV